METENDFKRAEVAHKLHDTMLTNSGQLTGALGIQAIKAPGFAAAASAVALLGFVSTNFDKIQMLLPQVQNILTWLMAVILISSLAHGGAYLSQFFVYEALDRRNKTFAEPYIEIGKSSQFFMGLGRALHVANILFVMSSYVALVFAGGAVLNMINMIMTSTPAA